MARAEGRRIALIDLAVVGSDEMAKLNRRYRGHRGPTDVLSFDLSDAQLSGPAGGVVGQIVVCGELAAAQGPRHGLTPQRELMLYVIHGLLHLTGYDDRSGRSAAPMHAREDELLARFVARRR